jgi:hypothetical protein
MPGESAPAIHPRSSLESSNSLSAESDSGGPSGSSRPSCSYAPVLLSWGPNPPRDGPSNSLRSFRDGKISAIWAPRNRQSGRPIGEPSVDLPSGQKKGTGLVGRCLPGHFDYQKMATVPVDHQGFGAVDCQLPKRAPASSRYSASGNPSRPLWEITWRHTWSAPASWCSRIRVAIVVALPQGITASMRRSLPPRRFLYRRSRKRADSACSWGARGTSWRTPGHAGRHQCERES